MIKNKTIAKTYSVNDLKPSLMSRITCLYLTSCRIVFDICFFYALIACFWNIEAILFHHSSNSIMHGLIVAVAFYHLLSSDRLKAMMLIGITVINIGLLFFSYLNGPSDVVEVAIVSIVSALISLATLAIWTYFHRCEKDRLPTYAVHVWKGREEEQ